MMTSKLGCDDFIYTMYSLVLIYCNSIMKHTKKEEQGYLHGGVAGSVNLKLWTFFGDQHERERRLLVHYNNYTVYKYEVITTTFTSLWTLTLNFIYKI